MSEYRRIHLIVIFVSVIAYFALYKAGESFSLKLASYISYFYYIIILIFVYFYNRIKRPENVISDFISSQKTLSLNVKTFGYLVGGATIFSIFLMNINYKNLETLGRYIEILLFCTIFCFDMIPFLMRSPNKKDKN